MKYLILILIIFCFLACSDDPMIPEMPVVSCIDGIQNGDEEGIDCGGTCPDACPSCSDGIQNGDEAGIDCGGSCNPCQAGHLGSYLGNMICPGLLSPLSSQEFAFEILESTSGEEGEVDILLQNYGVVINGTVEGAVISINSLVPSYPFDATGDGMPDITVDLIFVGELVVSVNGPHITGLFNIELRSSDTGALIGEDSCPVEAFKL